MIYTLAFTKIQLSDIPIVVCKNNGFKAFYYAKESDCFQTYNPTANCTQKYMNRVFVSLQSFRKYDDCKFSASDKFAKIFNSSPYDTLYINWPVFYKFYNDDMIQIVTANRDAFDDSLRFMVRSKMYDNTVFFSLNSSSIEKILPDLPDRALDDFIVKYWYEKNKIMKEYNALKEFESGISDASRLLMESRNIVTEDAVKNDWDDLPF